VASVASETSAVQMIMPSNRPDSAAPADPSSGFANILDATAGIAPASAAADASTPSADDGSAPAGAAPPAPTTIAQIALLLQAGLNLPSAKIQSGNNPTATAPASVAQPLLSDSVLVALAAPAPSSAPTADSDATVDSHPTPAKNDKSDKITNSKGTDAAALPDPTATVATTPPMPIIVAAPLPAPSPLNSAPSAASTEASVTAPAMQIIAANTTPQQTAQLAATTLDAPADTAANAPAQANSTPALSDDDDDSSPLTQTPPRTAPPTQQPADVIAANIKPKVPATEPDKPSNTAQPAANTPRETPDSSSTSQLHANSIEATPTPATAARGDDSNTAPALTGAPESKPSASGNAASANPTANPSAVTSAMQQQPFATLVASAPAHAAPTSAPAVPISGIAVEITARVQDGQKRFEIRLDPPDLGRIEVRLDVDTSGRVVTHVTTDRSDTLDLLRRDAPSLERALQSAGLTTDNGALQFSLRQQAFAGREQTFQSAAPAAQLIIPDSDGAPLDAALRRYGQLMGLGGGIDIRV